MCGFHLGTCLQLKKCHEMPSHCQTYYCLVTATVRTLLCQPCCLHSKLVAHTVLEKVTSLINTGSLESLRILPISRTSNDVTVRKTQLLLLLSSSSLSPSSKNGLLLCHHYTECGESNGKLPLRICPGCSVPEPYQSRD